MSGDGMRGKLEDVQCPICLEILFEPVVLPCAHELCMLCFREHIDKTSLQCPICRCRISVWAREAAREKKLINRERWDFIQKHFPNHIRNRKMGRSSSSASVSVLEDPKSHLVLAEPGEIHREYLEERKKMEDERGREREREEEASRALILRLQKDEDLALRQIVESDTVLATHLQNLNDSNMSTRDAIGDIREEVDRQTKAYTNYRNLAEGRGETEGERIKNLSESQFVVHSNPEDIFGYEPSQKPESSTGRILYAPKDVSNFEKIVAEERKKQGLLGEDAENPILREEEIKRELGRVHTGPPVWTSAIPPDDDDDEDPDAVLCLSPTLENQELNMSNYNVSFSQFEDDEISGDNEEDLEEKQDFFQEKEVPKIKSRRRSNSHGDRGCLPGVSSLPSPRSSSADLFQPGTQGSQELDKRRTHKLSFSTKALFEDSPIEEQMEKDKSPDFPPSQEQESGPSLLLVPETPSQGPLGTINLSSSSASLNDSRYASFRPISIAPVTPPRKRADGQPMDSKLVRIEPIRLPDGDGNDPGTTTPTNVSNDLDLHFEEEVGGNLRNTNEEEEGKEWSESSERWLNAGRNQEYHLSSNSLENELELTKERETIGAAGKVYRMKRKLGSSQKKQRGPVIDEVPETPFMVEEEEESADSPKGEEGEEERSLNLELSCVEATQAPGGGGDLSLDSPEEERDLGMEGEGEGDPERKRRRISGDEEIQDVPEKKKPPEEALVLEVSPRARRTAKQSPSPKVWISAASPKKSANSALPAQRKPAGVDNGTSAPVLDELESVAPIRSILSGVNKAKAASQSGGWLGKSPRGGKKAPKISESAAEKIPRATNAEDDGGGRNSAGQSVPSPGEVKSGCVMESAPIAPAAKKAGKLSTRKLREVKQKDEESLSEVSTESSTGKPANKKSKIVKKPARKSANKSARIVGKGAKVKPGRESVSREEESEVSGVEGFSPAEISVHEGVLTSMTSGEKRRVLSRRYKEKEEVVNLSPKSGKIRSRTTKTPKETRTPASKSVKRGRKVVGEVEEGSASSGQETLSPEKNVTVRKWRKKAAATTSKKAHKSPPPNSRPPAKSRELPVPLVSVGRKLRKPGGREIAKTAPVKVTTRSRKSISPVPLVEVAIRRARGRESIHSSTSQSLSVEEGLGGAVRSALKGKKKPTHFVKQRLRFDSESTVESETGGRGSKRKRESSQERGSKPPEAKTTLKNSAKSSSKTAPTKSKRSRTPSAGGTKRSTDADVEPTPEPNSGTAKPRYVKNKKMAGTGTRSTNPRRRANSTPIDEAPATPSAKPRHSKAAQSDAPSTSGGGSGGTRKQKTGPPKKGKSPATGSGGGKGGGKKGASVERNSSLTEDEQLALELQKKFDLEARGVMVERMKGEENAYDFRKKKASK